MDARRLMIVCLCVATASAAGCSGAAKKTPSDPFAQKPQAAAGATASTYNAPGQPITQVSYDASDAPGASLNDDMIEEQQSMWKRMQKNMSSKEIKRKYKAAVGRAPDEAVAQKAYSDGDALFREGKYAEAAKQFEIAADRWPESLLEEDALYMMGESYYFDDQYYQARNTFDQLLKQYENSRHLDRVIVRQFTLGRYWDEMGRDYAMLNPNFFDKKRPWFDTHGNGIKCYENIRLSDPSGPLADDAVMAQGTAYFRDNRFEDSAFQYEILRKDYPGSEHQKQAHLLGLQSYMNAYQGPQYDKTPLKKADALADSTIRNLGHTMPEERGRLDQAKEAIRAQTAERDYDIAEYYRRLGYNRAARSHYAVVLRDFPDTKFAGLSQQKIQEIEHLPDEPPDYFPWLTKMLARDRP
jgi:outer membrane protein assembly factor BamD (BamD/ComL family)